MKQFSLYIILSLLLTSILLHAQQEQTQDKFKGKATWLLFFNRSKNEDLNRDSNTVINRTEIEHDHFSVLSTQLLTHARLQPKPYLALDAGANLTANSNLSHAQEQEAFLGFNNAQTEVELKKFLESFAGGSFLAPVIKLMPTSLFRLGYLKQLDTSQTIGKSSLPFSPISHADLFTVRAATGDQEDDLLPYSSNIGATGSLNKLVAFDGGFPGLGFELARNIFNGFFQLNGVAAYLDIPFTLGDSPARYLGATATLQQDIFSFLSLGFYAHHFYKYNGEVEDGLRVKHLRAGASLTLMPFKSSKFTLYGQYDNTYGGSMPRQDLPIKWNGDSAFGLAFYEGVLPFIPDTVQFKLGFLRMQSLKDGLLTNPQYQTQYETPGTPAAQLVYPSLLKDWLEGRTVTDTDPGPPSNNDYQMLALLGVSFKGLSLDSFWHRIRFEEVVGALKNSGPISWSVKLNLDVSENFGFGLQYDLMHVLDNTAVAAPGTAADASQWRSFVKFAL